MKCSKTGCEGEGLWRIVIVARPAPPNEGEALGTTDMVLCETCMKLATLDEIVEPEAWDQLCIDFRKSGLLPPDRNASQLRFEALN